MKEAVEKIFLRTEYEVKESGLIKEFGSKPLIKKFVGKGARKEAQRFTVEHNKKVWAREIPGPIWVYKAKRIYGYVTEIA